ncbi:LacI family DNA-binding transcriptional regulator [uncultured Victivallis sp.]|mgnify:CR=1 FL=1|uniref:LacI family DNA-binding transcriptional regulator n=1 Tax=uncultured Victivallis sp. TaxID=354118 RepID=UPI0025846AE2|nr:LacI family DNA-binding transcriptional regulator [uncultured Victivallis sp.]
MISKTQKSSSSKIGMIAREAGCSTSTVSRILNGYSKGFSVRPELEEKVQFLARELNYIPNPYLRAMRSRKTRIIAVFDPFISDGGVPQRAKRRFITDIREAGYIESGKYAERFSPESYSITFPVDGALLIDIFDNICLDFVEKNHIPYVVVNGISQANGVSVQVDEMEDVQLLVEHLAQAGHKRIGYYGGHENSDLPQRHYSVISREKAYRENMDRLGLTCSSEPADYNINPIDFLTKCMQQGEMTAVICYDHIKTIALMHAAWQLGIRIPEQLSIVCFNDEEPLALLNPPITCVKTPASEMGSVAAKLLVDMIEGRVKGPVADIKISGKLVSRQSVRKLN